MTAYKVEGTLLFKKQLSQDIRLMEIKAPEIAKTAQPGQFVTLKLNHLSVPLLRRPFGVAGVDRDRGTLQLMYRIVGETTELMDKLAVGSPVDLLGPLGHGFAMEAKRPLLVGGGMGLAPLHFLAAEYKGAKPDVLIGGRTKAELFWVDLFKDKTGLQYETTDDGSCGVMGTVNAVLPQLLAKGLYDCVYVCGPSKMMRAVVAEVDKAGVPCQISLEKYMGCGLGACLSCTCSGIGKGVKVCKDGPVFWSGEVTEW